MFSNKVHYSQDLLTIDNSPKIDSKNEPKGTEKEKNKRILLQVTYPTKPPLSEVKPKAKLFMSIKSPLSKSGQMAKLLVQKKQSQKDLLKEQIIQKKNEAKLITLEKDIEDTQEKIIDAEKKFNLEYSKFEKEFIKWVGYPPEDYHELFDWAVTSSLNVCKMSEFKSLPSMLKIEKSNLEMSKIQLKNTINKQKEIIQNAQASFSSRQSKAANFFEKNESYSTITRLHETPKPKSSRAT